MHFHEMQLCIFHFYVPFSLGANSDHKELIFHAPAIEDDCGIYSVQVVRMCVRYYVRTSVREYVLT